MTSKQKPWTTFHRQIEILTDRGLTDAADYEHYLHSVGYYRLSGYWYPLRQFATPDQKPQQQRSDIFVPGAKMRHVIDLYEFDECLRLVIWQALCKLEIALRVDIGHVFGETDPYLHMHLEELHKTGSNSKRAKDFTKKVAETQKRSHEKFVQHHHEAYSDRMPIWVITEILQFGSLANLYSLAPFEQRVKVANEYHARADDLESWLRTMNYLRNICAHHARLWNRQIVTKPSTRGKSCKKLTQCLSRPEKLFTSLSIAVYLLECKGFVEEIRSIARVLTEFPTGIPGCSISDMGAPSDWQSTPLWAPYCA
ncbi:Abi family protein [Actinotignum timonense]|uniref:Abi family protein n=1 Tax=Actinotignum TaxID=1653174 RepID=UPI00254F47E1|nr:Abi family protein [Actinotignum timonense]MDK6907205.1 Abi family protein [Actinotignum timonense]MDK8534739.1 Abi family protein [Gleimia europaea]MDY5138194.1 Abi family protein [Actinotignum timonense]